MKEEICYSCITSFFCAFGFLYNLQSFCYGPDCEKLKYMCENLGAAYSLDVQLMASNYTRRFWIAKFYYRVVQLAIFAS